MISNGVNNFRFSMNYKMIDSFQKFCELKSKLKVLEEKQELDTSTLNEIEEINTNLIKLRNNFIREFKSCNKEEIEVYKQLRDDCK